ncbi:hypothetical protein EST38_g13900 [Candolleomyces aberdarensis]|uniref:Uncharacterized protein n=1 Tax=Candolleomyces aberdarensis TaxID=2316362 RepID=A0A4Q2D129_9AGAR|nr:hypothetical protein EST38_g13900 [Candolleomyces aberdarensis]
MTRVLLIPAPNFDLQDTLRQAMALDCEELDEDARGSKRDSEGRVVVAPAAPTGLPEPSRLMRGSAPPDAVRPSPFFQRVTHLCVPAASCGYQAVSERKGCLGRRYTVEDLRREGFVEIKWDGISSQVAVEEKTEKVMVVMAGQPDDPTYRECQSRVTSKILKAGEAAGFTAQELEHKRASNSAALNTGIFHGVGTSGPVNLSNGKRAQLLEDLVKDPDICRVASFADEVYEQVENKLGQLYEKDPSLRPPFECCVLPCAAFNFGPQVCCKGHRDQGNLPHSWCAITALGHFDPEQGGHLVIEELKIYIQFPPGATILIPSALLTHGNTPVSDGEVRLSFTVFCPGGLIRWVDNGFQTQDNLRKKVSKKEFQERMKLKETRWQDGLEKICTLAQLVDRYTPKKEDASSLDPEPSASAVEDSPT